MSRGSSPSVGAQTGRSWVAVHTISRNCTSARKRRWTFMRVGGFVSSIGRTGRSRRPKGPAVHGIRPVRRSIIAFRRLPVVGQCPVSPCLYLALISEIGEETFDRIAVLCEQFAARWQLNPIAAAFCSSDGAGALCRATRPAARHSVERAAVREALRTRGAVLRNGPTRVADRHAYRSGSIRVEEPCCGEH